MQSNIVLTKRQMSLNRRWYGSENPTEAEKNAIRNYVRDYALANNIGDVRSLSLIDNTSDVYRYVSSRLHPAPTPTPLSVPQVQTSSSSSSSSSSSRWTMRPLAPEVPQEEEDGVINMVYEDSWKGFKKASYHINRVNSLESYYNSYQTIADGRQNLYLTMKFYDQGQLYYRTINPKDLQTYGDFETRVDKFLGGNLKYGGIEVGGSDFTSENADPDLSHMTTHYYDVTGQGNNPDTLFAKKTISPKYPDALCLFNAIFSQINLIEGLEIDRNIESIDSMEKFLIENYGKGIKIYSDIVTFTPSKTWQYEEVMIDNKKYYLSKINNPKLVTFKHPSPICNDYVEIVYYENHFIPYEGVKDGDFYMDEKGHMVHSYKDIRNKTKVKKVKRQQLNKNMKENEEKCTTEIVTYDIETRYDESSLQLLKPYSISWSYKNMCYFYFGDDCVEKFLIFLCERQENVKFCLLGFNSSRFDNLFLIPELLNMDLLNNVFYQGSSILNIQWGNRHTVHDINRFTTCRLKDACENFQTKFIKVGDFDHTDIQIYVNEGKTVASYFHSDHCADMYKSEILSVDTSNKSADELKQEIIQKYRCKCPCKCSEPETFAVGCMCDRFVKLVIYNMFDVLSTHELYTKIEKICKDTDVITDSLFEYKTIGSTIYKKFVRDNKDANLQLPLLEYDDYARTRAGLYAGRTQCYKGVSYDLSRTVAYRMLDVKSLYPYVALNRQYPCGEVIKISYQECMAKNLIGFYRCKINQSAMRVKVIPKRSEKEPLDWTYGGDLEVFINTVDIKCILDYGGSVEILKNKITESGVTIEQDDGYAFSEKIDGNLLFQCLEKFKKVKEEQDLANCFISGGKNAKGLSHLSSERIEEISKITYNPALRNMSKLFLNSLTGKVIESLHLESAELVRTDKDLEKIKKKCDNVSNLSASVILNKCVGIVSYKKRPEDVFRKGNRPIYLGCLIYAYARDHMYREILADYDVIYQDTDSALIAKSEYDRFEQNKPESLGGEFGQFELEKNSEHFDSYVTLAPKNYFIFGSTKTDKDTKKIVKLESPELYKKGFKGIRLDVDKYIHDIDSEQFERYVSKKINSKGKVFYYIKNAFELYNQSNLVTSVYQDCERFINSIKANGTAYILTSSLNKTMRSSVSSNLQAGGIYQRFLLKKISIRKESEI